MAQTRTLTTGGHPLINETGQPREGVPLTFLLVDGEGNPVRSVFDQVSKEQILAVGAKAVTEADGEFEIDLWPTARALSPVFYQCTVDGEVFTGLEVLDKLTDLLWYNFINGLDPDAAATLEGGEFSEVPTAAVAGGSFEETPTEVIEGGSFL